MGVTIVCKKTEHSIDMGYMGFARMRQRIAELIDPELGQHIANLSDPHIHLLPPKEYHQFFDEFDAHTAKMINSGKWKAKIVDFLLQPDCGGKVRYGVCKFLVQAIEKTDENTIYGYAGHPNPATLKDFEQLCRECVENKCDLVWQ